MEKTLYWWNSSYELVIAIDNRNSWFLNTTYVLQVITLFSRQTADSVDLFLRKQDKNTSEWEIMSHKCLQLLPSFCYGAREYRLRIPGRQKILARKPEQMMNSERKQTPLTFERQQTNCVLKPACNTSIKTYIHHRTSNFAFSLNVG